VLLVGDGPARDALAHDAAHGPLAGRVILAGELDDVPSVMAVSPHVANPPEAEAFSLVALEAHQAGVPVVASATGGLPELVADGETGRLFPPGDIPALRRILAEFLVDPAPF
jgi:glycosyltransferase involved in cell wall biosynthesis